MGKNVAGFPPIKSYDQMHGFDWLIFTINYLYFQDGFVMSWFCSVSIGLTNTELGRLLPINNAHTNII